MYNLLNCLFNLVKKDYTISNEKIVDVNCGTIRNMKDGKIKMILSIILNMNSDYIFV